MKKFLVFLILETLFLFVFNISITNESGSISIIYSLFHFDFNLGISLRGQNILISSYIIGFILSLINKTYIEEDIETKISNVSIFFATIGILSLVNEIMRYYLKYSFSILVIIPFLVLILDYVIFIKLFRKRNENVFYNELNYLRNFLFVVLSFVIISISPIYYPTIRKDINIKLQGSVVDQIIDEIIHDWNSEEFFIKSIPELDTAENRVIISNYFNNIKIKYSDLKSYRLKDFNKTKVDEIELLQYLIELNYEDNENIFIYLTLREINYELFIHYFDIKENQI